MHLATFHLDDGAIAGRKEAMINFTRTLKQNFEGIGQNLRTGKCEVIQLDSVDESMETATMEGMMANRDKNFNLLGAPSGSDTYCESEVGKRRKPTLGVYYNIRKLDDPQCALHILRQTGAFCRMIHSIRKVHKENHYQRPLGLR